MERKFECDLCKKRLSSKSNLSYHIKTVHEGLEKVTCVFCEKVFPGNRPLNTHILTHIKERNYECELCSARFCTRNQRSIHSRVHTKEKPFQCKNCGKRFAIQGNLGRHEHIHSQNKPYSCVFCYK